MRFDKQPKFLSPSSLNQFEKEPNKFFLQRLSLPPRPREPQSVAAALGTIVDIEAKTYLMKQGLLNKYTTAALAEDLIHNRTINVPWYQPEKENKNLYDIDYENVEPHLKTDEVLTAGKDIAKVYIKQLIDRDITQWHDVDVKTIYNLSVVIGGKRHTVPIYGITDALVGTLEDGISPLDYKCTSGSPKKGWCFSIVKGAKLEKPENDINIPFDTIDSQWATQCCTYGWASGRPLFKPFTVFVDQICYGAKTLGVRIFRFQGTITPEFQKLVAARYLHCWDSITSKTGKERYSDKLGCTRLFTELMANAERWF